MRSKIERTEEESLVSLPEYLLVWKEEYDERWREWMREYDEHWRSFKESLPKKGDFLMVRNSGIAFYPDIALEEWK